MPQIHCPHCGQKYDLTDAQAPQYAGQTINCTACEKPFTVAGLGGTVPPPLNPQQPNYASPYTGAPQRTNGLAITSLVCGILGVIIPFIPSLIGVILGIIGLRKTRDPAVGGKGIAIAGIAASAATFFLGTCMLSILLPSLNRARETANRVKCASNMRQIGMALMMYGNDNRGQYPPDLDHLIIPEQLATNVFICPSTNDTPAPTPQALSSGGHESYIYVPGLNTSASAQTIVLYENTANHSGDGMNALFGDGHVEFLRKQLAARVITELSNGHNPPDTRGVGY